MSRMQDTPIGQIPADWSVEPIENLFTVSAGGDWDAEYSVKVQDAAHPFPVVANALTPGAIQGYCTYFTIPGDTLSITGRGDVGHAVYRPIPFVPIVRLLALVPTRPVSSRFFAEYINARVSFSLESTGVPQLTAPQIRPYLLAVPPIEEQRAIGSVLIDIGDQIAVLERLIAKKQAIKQGMMQQLLTGKTRLQGFTTEWVSGPLGKFMPLQRGFDLPISNIVPGKYPVVYSNGISRYHALAMVKGPGVTTGRSGTIGNVQYVKSDYWPHNTALWVTSFARTDAKFVYYFLKYLGLERFASGSGVPTFNRNDAHALQIQLPSQRKEQAAIANALSAIDDEISVLLKRVEKAKVIKQGMMQELLTGRTRLQPAVVAV